MKVLVIDVGGTNIKLMLSRDEVRKFRSGKRMTPERLIRKVKEATGDWTYRYVSIGFPGLVRDGVAVEEPVNLGTGWKHFDFHAAFKKPVKLANDAAMQALGSYDGGRMLFLGLGTSVGSTLIVENVVIPLELGQLAGPDAQDLSDLLGDESLKLCGVKPWRELVKNAVSRLHGAFAADYVVLGGCNARRVGRLPDYVRRGDNRDAYLGGVRLWESQPASKANSGKWRMA